jgi:hypothetical protein
MGCGSSRGDGSVFAVIDRSTEQRPLPSGSKKPADEAADSSEPDPSAGEKDALLQQYLLRRSIVLLTTHGHFRRNPYCRGCCSRFALVGAGTDSFADSVTGSLAGSTWSKTSSRTAWLQ